jgi:hypothetical protein
MKIAQYIILLINSTVYSGKPSEEQVMMYIAASDIQHKEIVAAQAIAETMHMKCTNCSMQFNNLFGFRVYGYLKFKHWTSSIDYYEQWQEKRYKDGEDYYAFLKRVRYAQSESYSKLIRSVEAYVRKRYRTIFAAAEYLSNAVSSWEEFQRNLRITIFAKALDLKVSIQARFVAALPD